MVRLILCLESLLFFPFHQKDDKAKESGGEMSAAAETETIENIMSFIQDETPTQKKSGGEDKDKEKDKDKDKEKEASVEEIFGKQGKRKSVYDLEPDGEDFSGKDSSTLR